MRISSLLFAFIFSALIGFGQQPPVFVDAQLRFLSNEKTSGIFIQPTKSQPGRPAPKAEIKAGTHGRSDPIKYNGPQILTVFSIGTGTDGAEVRTPLTSVTLPIEKKDLLVVLLVNSSPSGEKSYRASVYDDGFAASPVGSVRILNLTPVPMFGRLGSRNVEIFPGVSMTESFVGAATSRVSIGYMMGEKAMPVVDQSFEMEPTDRLLVAILPPFARGSGTARARIIRDSLAPVAPPAIPPRPR